MQKPSGPVHMLWSIVSVGLLLFAISFAWLVGSQAMRRVSQMQQGGAAGGAATSAAVGGMSGMSGVDPKEYKKEELPENSVRSFKDVRGCDEAKAELQVL